MEGKELIWVEKDFADKYKEMEKESSKNEERLKALDDYMQTVTEKTRSEYRSNLDALEEDVAMYVGLNLRVKQSFEKAKNEALSASYALWDGYSKEMYGVNEKIKKITDKLNPLIQKLNELNGLMGKINTWKFDNVFEMIKKLSEADADQKKMIKFLIDNFNRE